MYFLYISLCTSYISRYVLLIYLVMYYLYIISLCTSYISRYVLLTYLDSLRASYISAGRVSSCTSYLVVYFTPGAPPIPHKKREKIDPRKGKPTPRATRTATDLLRVFKLTLDIFFFCLVVINLIVVVRACVWSVLTSTPGSKQNV